MRRQSTILMRNQNALWSEPDLAGYLEKRGRRNESWKRRLFLLQGHALYYFLNEQQVQTMAPSAVIPVEGSRVKLVSSTESTRFVFQLNLGSRFTGLATRDTYVLAADSHEALEAWIRMLKIASYSRDALYSKLKKSRAIFGEIKGLLSISPSDTRILHESAIGFKVEDLQRQLRQGTREKEELTNQVEQAVLEADKREAGVAHATARWNLILYARQGKRLNLVPALEHELETIETLYKLLQQKGNLYQAQNIEVLHKDAQVHLQFMLQHAIRLIQDRHSKIRARAPRYSFHVDPVIYEEESFKNSARPLLAATKMCEEEDWVVNRSGKEENRISVLKRRAQKMYKAAAAAYRQVEKAEAARVPRIGRGVEEEQQEVESSSHRFYSRFVSGPVHSRHI